MILENLSNVFGRKKSVVSTVDDHPALLPIESLRAIKDAKLLGLATAVGIHLAIAKLTL